MPRPLLIEPMWSTSLRAGHAVLRDAVLVYEARLMEATGAGRTRFGTWAGYRCTALTIAMPLGSTRGWPATVFV